MSVLKTAFHNALIVLTGHKTAKDRLREAWLTYLSDLSTDEMPDGFRENFLAIRDGLTSQRPVNNEHPAEATIRKMSPGQAARWNQDIAKLYLTLIGEEAPVQLRLVDTVDGEETAVEGPVPEFLVQH
ncbi:MAG: hypothetical protein AAF290_07755 [Pseudomonadota bacterium]